MDMDKAKLYVGTGPLARGTYLSLEDDRESILLAKLRSPEAGVLLAQWMERRAQAELVQR
ncbi:hypothetical protein [Streptomyces lonarensis]|uniref:Uncharacterized protein n=1 Tax=Streptomyces lonarensis TaxID=700599 RepID=A0A7X6HX94_9ACTN|nr:hypothetical protein [Streptomyces lonarensis]NJQ04303.1 hypothetical protein [Streptomyces lonarensis]